MLTLNEVVVHYGGVQALKGISLLVEKGCITSLIGANGAGKSTTLKAISGLVPVSSGEIRFLEKGIVGLSPEKIVELGIGHVPEGKQLFLEMSVLDNLLTGSHLRKDTENMQQDLDRVYGYFPVLRRARFRKASQLSGGEQQMLAIGRGLMSKPKLLLLDEPSLGLSPLLTREVGAMIKRIADEGVPILLIEQNASLALQLAKSNYVMETGRIALQGGGKELQNNEHVRAAYLGISAAEEPEDLQGLTPRVQVSPEAVARARPEAGEQVALEAAAESRPTEAEPAEPLPPAAPGPPGVRPEPWREISSPAQWTPEWRAAEPEDAPKWTRGKTSVALRTPSVREEGLSRSAWLEERRPPASEATEGGLEGLGRREKAAPPRIVKRIVQHSRGAEG